ncbi:hypothetical protein Ancab_014884 [Ancistrocladus abbreviatus]
MGWVKELPLRKIIQSLPPPIFKIPFFSDNMTKHAEILFLEEWLRSTSGSSINSDIRSRDASTSSAQAIIQAWAELRSSLQERSFNPRHLQSLKSLVNSQASLYVADPQARLLLSILSSSELHLPHDSYPLIFRLLYIWARKSSKPSTVLITSAVDHISHLISNQFTSRRSITLFSEGVLLVGAFSMVPYISESTKNICVDLLCQLLEREYQVIGSVGELISYVLAGIGYALSSSGDAHFVRLLNSLFVIWGKIEEPCGIYHGLMVLHLIEWALFAIINAHSLEKIEAFINKIRENTGAGYAKFAVLMAAAGALKASSRFIARGESLDVISRLRISAQARVEAIAMDLIPKNGDFMNFTGNGVSFLLQCLSLAVSRCGGLDSAQGPMLVCLALALLTETFPLKRFYQMIVQCPLENLNGPELSAIKKHQGTVLFMESGATARVFCNLYASANDEDKQKVEDLLWTFCQDIYLGHRWAAMMLRGGPNELLDDLDKVAESAFLMVVLFAFAVTKQRLGSRFSRESQIDVSVKILVAFSYIEHFRRIHLAEYMDTIRAVVVSIQENESACVSFVESMPSYADLTNPQDSCLQKMKYIWSKDDVQTARILFYLRVIPTSVQRLPSAVFRTMVASVTFLYMGHPNVKVARASHLMFASFISSSKDSDQDERVSLKEQLVFYYMMRSLEAYPGNTPFDGLASGVAALVQHLPAGSPSIYYCIHSLVNKARDFCEVANQEAKFTKNWQAESDPRRKILELLLRLISMVDIQVLPELMKLLAQLIIQLPRGGQDMALNELYILVAESDDVTRKPTLVSWLHSLSYICSQGTSRNAIPKDARVKENSPITARL